MTSTRNSILETFVELLTKARPDGELESLFRPAGPGVAWEDLLCVYPVLSENDLPEELRELPSSGDLPSEPWIIARDLPGGRSEHALLEGDELREVVRRALSGA